MYAGEEVGVLSLQLWLPLLINFIAKVIKMIDIKGLEELLY
jgi:hypothetical protein